jgi:hypothetical protein
MFDIAYEYDDCLTCPDRDDGIKTTKFPCGDDCLYRNQKVLCKDCNYNFGIKN